MPCGTAELYQREQPVQPLAQSPRHKWGSCLCKLSSATRNCTEAVAWDVRIAKSCSIRNKVTLKFKFNKKTQGPGTGHNRLIMKFCIVLCLPFATYCCMLGKRWSQVQSCLCC